MIYIILLIVLVVLGLAGPLPYRVFYVATRNVTRLDGTFSKGRLQREVRYATSLLGEFLLLVIIVVSISGFILLVIHEYIVPLPMVADMLSQFDLDPVQWEYNIEHGELGDMGAKYEAWSRSRGFSESSARFWQEFLWMQWIALAAIGSFLAYTGGRFLLHFYGTALVKYAHGVLSRNKAYRRRDLMHMASRPNRSVRNQSEISEARFVDFTTDPDGRDAD